MRLFIFVLCLFLALFLSSPSVLLSRLQKYDPTKLLSFDWVNNFGSWGPILQKVLPPFVVIQINVVILYMLDYAAILEGHDSHSKYQVSGYVKYVIYMCLNLFAIPLLTISSGGKTIFELLKSSHWNFAILLSELFIPKSGEFFILLMI